MVVPREGGDAIADRLAGRNVATEAVISRRYAVRRAAVSRDFMRQEAVAGAHEKDLETQKKYGVRYDGEKLDRGEAVFVRHGSCLL
jgi:hypothetical protein